MPTLYLGIDGLASVISANGVGTDMLQRPQPTVDFPTTDAPGQSGPGELVDFVLGFLLRQYLVILPLVLLGGMAGVILLVVIPRTYAAQAKIFIGTQKAQFIQQQSLFAEAPIDNAQMDSQIQIVQSPAILESVVQKLKLADDPEFARPSIGLIGRVSQVLAKATPGFTTAEPEADATGTAIATLANRLTVNRVGVSFLIEIGVTSGSPEKSAQIANALGAAYIDDQQQVKRQANQAASVWLQERLQQLSERTAAADRAVLEFKRQNNIVSADGKRIDEQNLIDLNTRLVAARTHTSDVFARLTRIESIIRTWTPNATLDASIADELTNPILTTLRQQYLDLSRKESEYSARYGRDHNAVINIRHKLRELRNSAFDELRRIAAAFKSDYAIANQTQAELEKQLNQVISESQAANKAQGTLRELESRHATYHSLYDSFLQRYTGAIQQESFPLSEGRLVSLASAQETKVKPKPPLVFAVSLMGGIALGVGVGLLRDLRDRVFRTSTQVQSLLQIPCISVVPLLKTSAASHLRRGRLPAKTSEGKTIARDATVLWKAVDSPRSSFAESIRAIRLATHYYGTAPNSQVIGFTSALPNEGKSTIAGAVAQVMAQAGRRVIVVDCDLRIRSLSRRLAPDATVGIIDVISGVRSLEETVWRDSATNLFFLPTVTKGLLYSSEVLEAEPTKRFIDSLRASFDYVIVDLPPLVPIIDARAAAHLVDCMVLVIEWGRTNIDVVRHALDTIPTLRQAVIGAVLNKTNMNRLPQYEVHLASMYRNGYYAKYGLE